MDFINPPDCGPPPPAAVYPDISTAFTAIQAHAKAHRYAFFTRNSKPTRVVYTCDGEGKGDSRPKTPNIHEQRQRKGSRSKKCGCEIRVALTKDLMSSQ